MQWEIPAIARSGGNTDRYSIYICLQLSRSPSSAAEFQFQMFTLFFSRHIGELRRPTSMATPGTRLYNFAWNISTNITNAHTLTWTAVFFIILGKERENNRCATTGYDNPECFASTENQRG